MDGWMDGRERNLSTTPPSGASIYDLPREGGGCQEMQQLCRQMVKILQTKRGEGVKKSQNLVDADVIYGSILPK